MTLDQDAHYSSSLHPLPKSKSKVYDHTFLGLLTFMNHRATTLQVCVRSRAHRLYLQKPSGRMDMVRERKEADWKSRHHLVQCIMGTLICLASLWRVPKPIITISRAIFRITEKERGGGMIKQKSTRRFFCLFRSKLLMQIAPREETNRVLF